jgi:ribosomal protein S18 acetylase RimI-like enzyme
MSESIVVAPFEEGHREDCAEVLRRLPHWFGFASSNAEYIAALGRVETFVALRGNTVVGFVGVEDLLDEAAEIVVLAVLAELHGQGVGSALLARVEASLLARGRPVLHLKTLGPSDPDEGYAATRAFYRARGFRAVLETTAFWGEAQPTLVLVKLLDRTG